MAETVPENSIASFAVVFSDGTVIHKTAGDPNFHRTSLQRQFLPEATLKLSCGVTGRGRIVPVEIQFDGHKPPPGDGPHKHVDIESVLIQNKDGSFAVYDHDKPAEGWRCGGGGKNDEGEKDITFDCIYDGVQMTTINSHPMAEEVYLEGEQAESSEPSPEASADGWRTILPHGQSLLTQGIPDLHVARAKIQVYPLVPLDDETPTQCRFRSVGLTQPTLEEWRAVHSISQSLLARHRRIAVYPGTAPDGSYTCWMELDDTLKDEQRDREEKHCQVYEYYDDFVAALRAELDTEHTINRGLLSRPVPEVEVADGDIMERVIFEDRLHSVIANTQNIQPFGYDALNEHPLYPDSQLPRSGTFIYRRTNKACHTLDSRNVFYDGPSQSEGDSPEIRRESSILERSPDQSDYYQPEASYDGDGSQYQQHQAQQGGEGSGGYWTQEQQGYDDGTQWQETQYPQDQEPAPGGYSTHHEYQGY